MHLLLKGQIAAKSPLILFPAKHCIGLAMTPADVRQVEVIVKP
jgi:hypothetical protein